MKQTSRRSAVGAPDPAKFISLDGLRLAYSDTEGSGPVIVCLHAIGHGAGDFQDLSKRLRSEYRVIALDLPGHGRSDDDSQPASAIRYGGILARFIGELKLNRVVLLGNSVGGAAAIRLAAERPEHAAALVLCNPGGLDQGGRLARVFTGAFVRFFAAGRRRAFWFPWAFGRYYRTVLSKAAASAQRERIVASAFEIAPVLEQAWNSFAEPEADLRDRLASIQCPILLAWARDDRTNQLKRCRPAFERFPSFDLRLFEGGHAAFLEDPDAFERVLREFLEKAFTTGNQPDGFGFSLRQP